MLGAGVGSVGWGWVYQHSGAPYAYSMGVMLIVANLLLMWKFRNRLKVKSEATTDEHLELQKLTIV